MLKPFNPKTGKPKSQKDYTKAERKDYDQRLKRLADENEARSEKK